MSKNNKFSITPCTGMSPYGLIARVAAVDTVEENENAVSICITATSAEKGGYKDMIEKYPIIAVNGCENACVNKILAQKGVKVDKTVNAMKVIGNKYQPQGVGRLDKEGENCVEIVKKRMREILQR